MPTGAADARLYDQVAGRLATAIRSGALRPGERLPSVRELARQDRVSVSTVLEAYARLEAEGLVEARPQSGHYVRARAVAPEPRAARPLASAAPVTVSALVARVYAAHRQRDIVPLAMAGPGSELLPSRKLAALLASSSRRVRGHGIDYEMPPGSLELRRQIARRSLAWGCALSPDEIVITSGCIEAVNLCLAAIARPGDTVAVEAPSFYGTLQALEAHGLKALEIPTDPREGLDLEALEAALERTRVAAVLAVPTFSNPLGAVMPDANKRELVRMLAARGIPLIEDDIYGDLHHGPDRPRVARCFDRDGNVLLCSSFSKTLAPGYRVGFVAPGRFQEAVEVRKFSASVATATPPQLAIAEFLRSGGYDRHLRGLRSALAASAEQMRNAVAEHFPRGTCVTRPAGGAMLWVELPRGVSALELHRRALEAGVSVAPGPIFSARQRFESCIRLGAGLPWSERVAGAVATVGRIARELAAGAGSSGRARPGRQAAPELSLAR